MITAGALNALVFLAVGMATLIPILLIVMVYIDWKRGNLW